MSLPTRKATLVGAGPQTSSVFGYLAPADQNSSGTYHAFVSGVFGSGASVQIQYSPDDTSVSDGASRWFAPAVLKFTAGGDTWFTARFRKMKFTVAGGDGTNNVTVEIV